MVHTSYTKSKDSNKSNTKILTHMIKNSPSIMKVDNLADYLKIAQNKTNINLLIFCAEWSGTSHMLLESLKERGKDFSLLFNRVVVVDFDKSKELVEKFNIEDVPTSVLLNDDDVFHTFSGLFSFDEINKIVEQEMIKNNNEV